MQTSPAAVFVGDLPFKLSPDNDPARDAGYTKILVSDSAGRLAPSAKDYDVVVPADVLDPDSLDQAIVKLKEEFSIETVQGFSEVSVIPAAYVAEKTGGKGLPLEVAINCRNKFRMKQCLQNAGVNVPPYYALKTVDDLGQAVEQLGGFPLVCKPVLGFASQGVRRVDEQRGLTDAIRQIRRENRFVMRPYYAFEGSGDIETVLLESFVDGREIAVDGIVMEGTVQILLSIDKPDVSNGPYFGDSIHVAPAGLNELEQEAVQDIVEKAVEAVGIRSGPFHLEGRLSADGFCVLEVGARIGFPRLLKYTRAIDIVSLAVANALGRMPEFDSGVRSYAGTLCINANKLGTFRGVANFAEIDAISSVHEIVMLVKPGDRVAPPPAANTYIGFVIAVASSRDKVERTLYRARDEIDLRID